MLLVLSDSKLVNKDNSTDIGSYSKAAFKFADFVMQASSSIEKTSKDLDHFSKQAPQESGICVEAFGFFFLSHQ